MDFHTKTKHEQLAEYLRSLIGIKYKKGDKFPPEEKLALELGVNKATVAKAMTYLRQEGYITRKPGVGTVVYREKVFNLKSILLASPFSQQKLSRDNYYSRLLLELTSASFAKDFMLSLVDVKDEFSRQINYEKLLSMAQRKDISSLIVLGAKADQISDIEKISRETQIPVLWHGIRSFSNNFNFIDTDNYATSIELFDIAAKKGFKKIFLISKKLDSYDRRERDRAFNEKYPENREYIIETDSTVNAGYEAMKELLKTSSLPDCIFATDMGNLTGLKRAIEESNKGQNIPILTFDYNYDIPDLNVIASAVQPISEFAKSMVEFSLLEKHQSQFKNILKNKIITHAQ